MYCDHRLLHCPVHSLQARVSAWSGVPVSTAPNTSAAAAAAVQPDAAMAAMAAAAAAAAGGLPDSSAYPAVLRDALGQVPAQAMGRQMYPNIPPGGVASHFNAAAAAAGDQVRTASLLRQYGCTNAVS